MTPRDPLSQVMLALAVLGVAINAMSGGNVALAVAPAAALVGLWALCRVPLRYPLLAVIFVALVLDNPQDRPQQYLWKSLFYAPGEVFHLNLHNVTGISFLRFSLLELCLALLACIAAVRVFRRSKEEGPRLPLAAFPLRRVLLVYGMALLVWCTFGLIRGGNLQQMLWQVRQMAWMPVVVALGIHAFRGRADLWRGAIMMVTAALVRAAEGIYYHQFICRPMNFKPDYVTTHSDSVLFVAALMVLMVAWMERPGVATTLALGLAGPVLAYVLVINNRRLAFVSLLVSFVVVAVTSRRGVRLRLARFALAGAPLLAAYVVIGWGSTAKVFAPIAALRSATDSQDTSNQTRDIENGNLIGTLDTQVLMGSGFGHEYVERVHAYDIQKMFPQYRYIAHNSVLWLWSQAGLLGFSLLWMPMVVAAFLAARSYRGARTSTSRVAAMTCLTVLVCFAGQAYGDMGLQSWTATLILSLWLGLLGRLAVVTGGWPAHARGVTLVSWPSNRIRPLQQRPEAVAVRERMPT